MHISFHIHKNYQLAVAHGITFASFYIYIKRLDDINVQACGCESS